jgi:CBS domain-containing protein
MTNNPYWEIKAMKIKNIMTKPAYRVSEKQTLNDAAQLMWDQDCGWLPVVDDNDQVIAAVTDRDIAMAAYLNGNCLTELPVAQAHSQSVVACTPTDDIEQVEEVMQEHRIRRLPVIDKGGSLVGVVALNDIARAYQADRKESVAIALSDTLAAICGRGSNTDERAAVA